MGVEALLRWEHPVFGSVSPQVFIPVAEESGLIISIGAWVLKTACEQVVIWQKLKKYSTLKMSVNISVKQFQEESFVNFVNISGKFIQAFFLKRPVESFNVGIVVRFSDS